MVLPVLARFVCEKNCWIVLKCNIFPQILESTPPWNLDLIILGKVFVELRLHVQIRHREYNQVVIDFGLSKPLFLHVQRRTVMHCPQKPYPSMITAAKSSLTILMKSCSQSKVGKIFQGDMLFQQLTLNYLIKSIVAPKLLWKWLYPDDFHAQYSWASKDLITYHLYLTDSDSESAAKAKENFI